MISPWLRLLVILLLIGCASRDKNADQQGIIVTPGGNRPGTVVSANPTARFVVVRFPIGDMPPLNQRMNAYRQGLKVADLRVSGPQRDIHVVADVIAGESRVGDEVRAD